MVPEVRTIALPVAIETHTPLAGTWQAGGVAVIATIGKVRDDNNIIARPTLFPPVKGDDFVRVIDVMDVDMLPSQPARVVEPVSRRSRMRSR